MVGKQSIEHIRFEIVTIIIFCLCGFVILCVIGVVIFIMWKKKIICNKCSKKIETAQKIETTQEMAMDRQLIET